jgi:signal peptidase II
MPKTTFFNSGFRWVWISILILIGDRLTKEAALLYLTEYSPLKVTTGFNLILSYNKGAAFSFLNQAAGWQVWFFGVIAMVVSLVILIWMRRLSWREYWVSIALSLVVGGALGNLWDRISYGHVIDFIQLYISRFYWPVFNVADSAITVGAVMLFLHAFKKN